MSNESINLDSLAATDAVMEPFPWLIVPGFVRADAIAAIEEDYPQVTLPGSLPLPSLKYGKAFARFMDDIQSPQMTSIIGKKLGIDLRGRPTTVTVRGQCRKSDGKIHTDSDTKLVTVLIYMNGNWDAPGGRLRLLRSSDDLNDVVAEVPPERGTMVAFLNHPNAWHGHESFEGPRRAIQLNWVTDMGVVRRELWRHRISAAFKKIRRVVSGK